MTQIKINVKSTSASKQTLMAFFEGKGMTMAKQCNEGICGTCRLTVSNPDAFEEVHPQLGYKDDDQILPCAVRLKEGKDSDVLLQDKAAAAPFEFHLKP
jgi:ferredoxin